MVTNATKNFAQNEVFEALRTDPRLCWIERVFDLVNGRNLIQEFDWVRNTVKTLEQLGWAIIMFMWTFFFVLCYLAWHSAHPSSCLSIISYFVVWGISAYCWGNLFICPFSKAWDDYINLWVETHWINRDFKKRLDDVILGAGGNGAYGHIKFDYLAGTDDEVKQGVVPVKVRQSCIQYLNDLGATVCNLPKDDTSADLLRGIMKGLVATYKKFGIVSPDARVSNFCPVKNVTTKIKL